MQLLQEHASLQQKYQCVYEEKEQLLQSNINLKETLEQQKGELLNIEARMTSLHEEESKRLRQEIRKVYYSRKLDADKFAETQIKLVRDR